MKVNDQSCCKQKGCNDDCNYAFCAHLNGSSRNWHGDANRISNKGKNKSGQNLATGVFSQSVGKPGIQSDMPSPAIIQADPASSFELKIDFEKHSDNPGRVFQAMAQMIESFHLIGQVTSDVGQVREQSNHHEHKAEQTEFFDDKPYSQGVEACRRRIQFAVVSLSFSQNSDQHQMSLAPLLIMTCFFRLIFTPKLFLFWRT